MTFIFQQESREEYLYNDKAKTHDVSLSLADRSLTKAVTRQLFSFVKHSVGTRISFLHLINVPFRPFRPFRPGTNDIVKSA